MNKSIITFAVHNNTLELLQTPDGEFQVHEIRGDFPVIDEDTGENTRWVVLSDKDISVVLEDLGKRITYLRTNPVLGGPLE